MRNARSGQASRIAHAVGRAMCGASADAFLREFAIVARPKREYAAWPAQVLRRCLAVGKGAQRVRPVGSGHTGSAVEVVDGDGERGLMRIGVVGDHRGRRSSSARASGIGAQRIPVVWRTMKATCSVVIVPAATIR